MNQLESEKSAPQNSRGATSDGKHVVGIWHLILGVVYPGIVIAIEFVTRFCAETFFDPMPTFLHTLLVLSVPIGNFLVWWHLRQGAAPDSKWIAFTNGTSIAIAGFYTLLFLPLVPIALIAVVIWGMGLLPLAPLASLVSTVLLRRAFRKQHARQIFRRHFLGGVAASLALLLLLDVPAAATRLGIQWAASDSAVKRERGLVLLRTLGDDDVLLRLCYDSTGRPDGLLTWLVVLGHGIFPGPDQQTNMPPTTLAREIYYRVHGVPFNTKPAPFANGQWSRFANFEFDNDLGGTQVGGRVKGLDLIASRIDGSINGDEAVAYLEWVFEFRNSSFLDREARLQLALPPGAVVSRATLWINGEEREAAYGGRGLVRAAYERVAVRQQRDPLLVTTKGADRVLAQAFPVARGGGTIKFKIGITAPLSIVSPNQARFALPAIIDRNFSFAPEMRHAVWLESARVIGISTPGLKASRVSDRLFRIEGAVGDTDLARVRQTVVVERDAAFRQVVARRSDSESIVQDVVSATEKTPGTLYMVIDGSARLRDVLPDFVSSLDKIPQGSKVGVVIASEPLAQVSLAPWSAAHKQKILELIHSASFIGGQDNTMALVEALKRLESEPNAVLLWIHGPQPVRFLETAGRLEQATIRLSRLPQVWLYGTEPGPNELLPDSPWAWSARSLPQTGAVDTDLGSFFEQVFGTRQTFSVRRTAKPGTGGRVSGSEHIAKLWANDRVLSLMRENPVGNRATATALATRYQLVTPVSGAVVLETQEQYDQSRLTPADQATVPTIPEPEEWILILLAFVFALIWLVRRRAPLTAAA